MKSFPTLSIWIMFMKPLEHLELNGSIEVRGACDKGMDLLRKECIIKQRNGSCKRGFGAPGRGLEHLEEVSCTCDGYGETKSPCCAIWYKVGPRGMLLYHDTPSCAILFSSCAMMLLVMPCMAFLRHACAYCSTMMFLLQA